MSKPLFSFDVIKGKRSQVYYVAAKNFKEAATKFYSKYPKANVNSVWRAARETIPVIIK